MKMRVLKLSQGRGAGQKGFTLIELIAVMSIIIIMISLAVPGLNAIKEGNLGQSASDIASSLEMARAYAMAKNTYVFVGITEDNGRVLMAMVESKDGSNNFDSSGGWRRPTTVETNLSAINKLRVVNNVHMVDFSSSITTTGPMASRGTVIRENSLGSSESESGSAVFSWPVGAAAAKYNFKKVIQFNPQGMASIQKGTLSDVFTQRMEIGLQRPHGQAPEAVTDISKQNVAALQIDGVSGATRIFQP